MKKRIAAFLLLLVMVCAVVLTSCNNSTEIIDDEDVRRALTITLYCITDEKTTPDAIQRVENAINQITRKRYSTQIKLRFYKESEYNGVIDNLVADIALEEKQKADNESLSAAAAKESRRIAAIDKLIAVDKAEVTTKKLIVWTKETEEEEESEEETYETTQNIFGEDVEKYPDATDTQLDIFLICGTENLNKYVTEEPYATDDESFLVSMDESLTLNSKTIKQYVSDTILLAGKVGNTQYAIPTNKRMAGESTYLVLDRALMKKYGYSEDDIRNLTSAKFASFLHDVKENETDVVPLKNAPDAPGIVSLFGEESIFGTYVANTAVTGFKAVPKNLLSAYQYTDHIKYMEQFRRNGYIEDKGDEARYAAQVITADEDDLEKYPENKYVVKILGKGMATTETIGQYMFGISKYTRDPNRCMEIITLITTNSEIRNLLQYGVEGYNYKVDEEGRLTRLNNEYMMDIFATGNTFIAYPEEDMELDVWEKDKAANRTAIVSPYLGFLFEKENNAELVEKMKALSNSLIEQIKNFDVEAERVKKIESLTKELEGYQKSADKYKEQLDAQVELEDGTTVTVRALAEDYLKRIEDGKAALEPLEKALNEAKAAVKTYDSAIDKLNTEIKDLKKKITDEQKVKPTDDNPDLKPDEAKIAEWQKQIEDDEREIRAQRGFSYELRKELTAAQTAYDEANAPVKALEAEYNDRKVPATDDSGKEVALATAYSARLNNYTASMTNVEDLQAQIDALYTPEQSKLDADYAELEKLLETSTAEYDRMSKEYEALNLESKNHKTAIETAENAVKEAKEKLDAADEETLEARKSIAVALSYVEDKEKEIASNKDEAKAEQLNAELAEVTKAYNDEAAKNKAATDKYEAALADYEAKTKALDDERNAEVFKKTNELDLAMGDLNKTIKKATSDKENFKHNTFEYYDAIASDLYDEYFKGIVTDLETNNTDYQQFMNIGEEYADNENGVVSIYNEWYSATYGE